MKVKCEYRVLVEWQLLKLRERVVALPAYQKSMEWNFDYDDVSE